MQKFRRPSQSASHKPELQIFNVFYNACLFRYTSYVLHVYAAYMYTSCMCNTFPLYTVCLVFLFVVYIPSIWVNSHLFFIASVYCNWFKGPFFRNWNKNHPFWRPIAFLTQLLQKLLSAMHLQLKIYFSHLFKISCSSSFWQNLCHTFQLAISCNLSPFSSTQSQIAAQQNSGSTGTGTGNGN